MPGSFSQHHSLHPEDRGSKVLQNDGILLQHYTASQPRRLQLQNICIQNGEILDLIKMLSLYGCAFSSTEMYKMLSPKRHPATYVDQ